MPNSEPDDLQPFRPKQEEDAHLDAWLERHIPGLRRFLSRRASQMVLAKESAEDLAQSACREAVERLNDGRLEIRTEAEFKQWLYQAGLHKLHARTRFHLADRRDARRELRSISPQESRDPGVDPATSATPSRFAVSNEERERVHAAIQRLGERDQRILTLVVLEGRTHSEVAEILCLEPASSRMALSRAMARLAKKLQD